MWDLSLSAEELMLLNCGVGEDSWGSLGLQGDQTSQSYSGNKSCIFTKRTDEAPILWPSDAKSRLIRKDPDAGKDWRQEEKGMTEDELVGWHHWLSGHEFEQALGFDDGQGSLPCYTPWGHKESDKTEQLTWLTPLLKRLWFSFHISNTWCSLLWKYSECVFLNKKPIFSGGVTFISCICMGLTTSHNLLRES